MLKRLIQSLVYEMHSGLIFRVILDRLNSKVFK